jgi:hypothetical protein
VLHALEILFAEAQRGGAEELGIAADVVIGGRREFRSLAVTPGFARGVFAVVEDGLMPRSMTSTLTPACASRLAMAPPPTPAPTITTS